MGIYHELEPADFLIAQARVLEDLLGEEWFRAPSRGSASHPAYQRWSLCQRLLESGARVDGLCQAGELLRVVLDNAWLVDTSGGDIRDIRLSSFDAYGDSDVRKRLAAEIHDPRKFLDVLTELSYASTHIGRHPIYPSQAHGRADFRIELPTGPLLVDCKRLLAGSSLRRVSKVLQSANRQIKKWGEEASGLAVLDIAARVPLQLMPRETPAADDAPLPTPVNDVRLACEQSLASVNRSVSGALIVWDDCEVLGDPWHCEKSLFFMMRRSITVRHATPRLPLPPDSASFETGFTVGLWVTWASRTGTSSH